MIAELKSTYLRDPNLSLHKENTEARGGLLTAEWHSWSPYVP